MTGMNQKVPEPMFSGGGKTESGTVVGADACFNWESGEWDSLSVAKEQHSVEEVGSNHSGLLSPLSVQCQLYSSSMYHPNSSSSPRSRRSFFFSPYRSRRDYTVCTLASHYLDFTVPLIKLGSELCHL